jgi:hypothetical protein
VGAVPLKTHNGTYVVPVLVNDTIPLDFMIESGATHVVIPADVVSTLFRTGTVRTTDFIGNQTSVLADGSNSPLQYSAFDL